nr:hypothetical protein [bacterium]
MARRFRAIPRWVFWALGAVVIAAGIFLGLYSLLGRTTELTPLSVSPRDVQAPFSNGLLQLRNDKLVLHNPQGGDAQEFADAFPDGKLVTDVRLAAVWNAQHVYVYNINASLVLKRDYSDVTVLAVRLAQNGIGILTRDGDNRCRLATFNSQGTFQDEIDLKDQVPLDFGLYGQPLKVWVTLLETQSETHVTRLLTYEKGQSLTGNVAVAGELVTTVYPMKDTLMLVGTSHVFVYDYTGAKKSEVSIHGWQMEGLCSDDPEQPLLILSPQPAAQTQTDRPVRTLWIYSPGKEDTRISLPANTFFAAAGDKKLWVMAGTTIQAYSYTGAAGKVLELGTTPDGVIPIPGTRRQVRAVVTSGDNLYIVQLP